jgi:hypothetical protein
MPGFENPYGFMGIHVWGFQNHRGDEHRDKEGKGGSVRVMSESISGKDDLRKEGTEGIRKEDEGTKDGR